MNTDTSFDPADYRWPAEWEPHTATWTAWPVSRDTWPGIFDRIPPAFADFVAAIATFEPVNILATKEVAVEARPLVENACETAAATHEVRFVDIPVNDSWCRDYGPIFLNRRHSNSQLPPQVILNWDYNSWGGKYPPWDLDAAAADHIARLLQLPQLCPGKVLEGGAIDGNGHGTILTTSSCLLNPNRNGPMTAEQWEGLLARYLGAGQIVWLSGHGILGDDTDGHIDQVARFTAEAEVVAAVACSEDAPEAAVLRSHLQTLQDVRMGTNRRLTIRELRLPQPCFQQQHRLPASYCNFCICNGGVVVPAFGDPADDDAAAILQSAMPDRRILPVPARDLVWGLGAFHCLTQQQPLPV